MNVKSKCTIPANHFEYFIMGAKYHYSPPVQSTPSAYRHRAGHPSREPRANSSVTVRYEALYEAEWRRRGDGEGNGGRGRAAVASTARGKRTDGGTRGRRGGFVRARGRGKEGGGTYAETRAADASRREHPRNEEARGARVHVHTCVRTRVRARVRPASGAGTSGSARDTGYATGTKLRSP